MFVYYMLEFFEEFYELVLDEGELDVLVKRNNVVFVVLEIEELMFLVMFVEWLGVFSVMMEELWILLLFCVFWYFLVLLYLLVGEK